MTNNWVLDSRIINRLDGRKAMQAGTMAADWCQRQKVKNKRNNGTIRRSAIQPTVVLMLTSATK